jgi:L-fucose mutarotase
LLKGIHPLLDADLLYALSAMGHGDELAIVDRNFPAAALARRLVRLTGQGTAEVAAAVFTVFPIDSFVNEPLIRMQVVGHPDDVLPVQAELLEIATRAEGRSLRMGSLPRGEFYERTRGAFLVVATGEAQGYGNFLVGKGGVADHGS